MTTRILSPKLDVDVMAPLFVPSPNSHGARIFSRVLSQPVHSTISNLSYAPITNINTSLAGPFTPNLLCDCQQSNPDSCVNLGQEITTPYLSQPLSQQYMVDDFQQTPSKELTKIDSYLRHRVAPMGYILSR